MQPFRENMVSIRFLTSAGLRHNTHVPDPQNPAAYVWTLRFWNQLKSNKFDFYFESVRKRSANGPLFMISSENILWEKGDVPLSDLFTNQGVKPLSKKIDINVEDFYFLISFAG
jgi:hypothetical protein